MAHFVIASNQVGPFSKPERHHKTSDRYPLRELVSLMWTFSEAVSRQTSKRHYLKNNSYLIQLHLRPHRDSIKVFEKKVNWKQTKKLTLPSILKSLTIFRASKPHYKTSIKEFFSVSRITKKRLLTFPQKNGFYGLRKKLSPLSIFKISFRFIREMKAENIFRGFWKF